MVTSGNVGGVMVNTMAGNARDVGSNPTRGAIFPIVITPTTLVVQAMLCMVVEPTLCMHVTAYMYVIRVLSG